MIQRVTKRRGNISWHQYTDDCEGFAGQAYPGATTIINKKANPFLSEWFKREGARAVLQQADKLPDLMSGFTEDSLVKMFASSADKKRDDAGDRGTHIHAAIEHFLNKEKVADCAETGRHDPPCSPDIEYIRPALAGFWKWVQATQPRIVATEFMVISHEHRYAATGDLACWIGDDLWLIDAKTSKGVYETTALQLAAIRFADHGEDGKPPPQATRFGVLHVRDDATELVPFDVRPDTEFGAFLACRDLYEWDKSRARVVKGVAA